MNAEAALTELLELSSQVATATLLGADGGVEATTVGDPARAARLARVGGDLLAIASDVRVGDVRVSRVEVALAEGSVFAVREGDRTIVATTVPEPTAGLVLYDLRTALRRVGEAEPKAKPKPKPRVRKKPESGDA